MNIKWPPTCSSSLKLLNTSRFHRSTFSAHGPSYFGLVILKNDYLKISNACFSKRAVFDLKNYISNFSLPVTMEGLECVLQEKNGIQTNLMKEMVM